MDKFGDILGTKLPLFPVRRKNLRPRFALNRLNDRKLFKTNHLVTMADIAMSEIHGYSRAVSLG